MLGVNGGIVNRLPFYVYIIQRTPPPCFSERHPEATDFDDNNVSPRRYVLVTEVNNADKYSGSGEGSLRNRSLSVHRHKRPPFRPNPVDR